MFKLEGLLCENLCRITYQITKWDSVPFFNLNTHNKSQKNIDKFRFLCYLNEAEENMNKEELLEKYNNNQDSIKRISYELQQLAKPMNIYRKKKEQTENIDHCLTQITCRISGSALLLALIPILPFRLAGLTMLTFVTLCKAIVLCFKIRDNKYKKLSSANICKYNDAFKEQYDLLQEQEKLKTQIEQLNPQEITSKSNLITKLTDIKSVHLDKTSVDCSSRLNYEKDIAYRVDISSKLPYEAITRSVDTKSGLTDQIFRPNYDIKSKLTDKELKLHIDISSKLPDDIIYKSVDFS